ncbi:hypothetical protein SAMN05428939_7863 [Streptomyces sp. TLI_105]|nr:hypothetical protein SAMN05428939_7863 [Streptomyces sp. TLI_105]
MAPPVRVRRLTEQEGQKLQHIVRRGSTSSVLFCRPRPAAARSRSSHGWSRRTRTPSVTRSTASTRSGSHALTLSGREAVPACSMMTTRTSSPRRPPPVPTLLGKPFTRWSIRKLADHLRRNGARPIRIGREALRCLLTRHGITFQRTKTWKESPDPDIDAKPARIEYAVTERPGRTFAFDEFGPLGIRPTAGSCWAKENRPDRLPATYRRTQGITYFHGCSSVGDDRIRVVNQRRKGIDHTWAALRSMRDRPDPGPAPLPVLAQQQCPPPRRPGRPTRRTRPRPWREGHPLGRPASPDRGLIVYLGIRCRPGRERGGARHAIRPRAAAHCAWCLRGNIRPSPPHGRMPGWPPSDTDAGDAGQGRSAPTG